MEFTFYGDLLGISSLYRLSPRMAYEKLNEFYNTTFSSVEEDWALEKGMEVSMFSDSILIWGDHALSALEKLSDIYVKLFHKGILLRGGMVKSKINFNPRLDRKNFRKMLPETDTLARAVGIGSTQKGARLIVESQLAEELLGRKPVWLTHDGYIRNVNKADIPYKDILRRICPTPDSSAYEVLYFWTCSHESTDYRRIREELEEMRNMVRDDVGEHYKVTLDLLRRCQSRQTFTAKHLGVGVGR